MLDGYKVSAVAKATGIPIDVLTRDLDREVIKIPEPKPGSRVVAVRAGNRRATCTHMRQSV
jgi:hypothetical protein